MLICRSKVEIYKKGEKEDFNCEILVLNSLKNEEKNQIILISKDGQNKSRNYDIEDFSNMYFYEYLNDLVQKHQEYSLSLDARYLISIFANNLALNYISVDRHFEPFTIKECIDKEREIYARITTYELNVKYVLKDILDIDNLYDLDEETFKCQINKYIEKEMLKKINFLNSIKIYRLTNSVSKRVANIVEKINGFKTFDIYLKSLSETKIQTKRVADIDFAYTRGLYISSRKSKKNHNFLEDDDGDYLLLIINKGKYTKDDIVRKFHLKYSMTLGKAIVGITYSYNLNYINK